MIGSRAGLLFLVVVALLMVSGAPWCYYGKVGHTNDVYEATYSPDGSKIVVASRDGRHYIYDALSFAIIYQYISTIAYTAKYSPDRQYIAFGLQNSTVIVLSGVDYSFVTSIALGFSTVWEVHFNANSNKLLVCGGATSRGYQIFAVPGWNSLKTDVSASGDALSCRFANNDYYAVGFRDGFIKVYNAATAYSSVWTNRRTTNSEIAALDFSPNSSQLLAAWSVNGQKVGIFTVSSNTSEANLTSVGTDILAVDWSSDGSVFALGKLNHNALINNGSLSTTWNTVLETETEATDDVYSVDFSYDSQWLVTGSKDNYIYVYRRDCSPQSVYNLQYCPA
jgi:WD40 repeat protein